MSFAATLPYQLPLLPPRIDVSDKEVTDLVLKAQVKLGELRGYTLSLSNPFLLLSPAIIKESVASSEIENIHTTILNVLENELFPEDEKTPADKEVLHYREAVMWGFQQHKEGKTVLSSRAIQGIHHKLIPDLNGQFRTQQNAIQDQRTKKIIYTPPVQGEIPRLMGNLENYMNQARGFETADIDPLVRAAICHYQFEALHPFGDGNGRTGRILMVLGLLQSEILLLPTLYISGYINKNKNEYYRLLLQVTTDQKWKEYILFMLQGFYEQAQETTNLARGIMALYLETKSNIKSNHKKIYSSDLIEAIFTSPIINPVKLASVLGVHYMTASRHLAQLEKIGVLKSKWVGKYHFFANTSLLQLLHA